MSPAPTLAANAKANAKVNLFLAVQGRRRDGYHEIATVLQNISLADDLVVAEGPGPRDHIVVEFEPWLGKVAIAEEQNLVLRAALLVRERTADNGAVEVHLHKRIPLGAGLGGGSADAACALIALNRLWMAGLSEAELGRVGAELGSDVPFCLVGGTALATGRGEVVSRVEAPQSLWFVLGMSSEPLSTAAVYQGWSPGAPVHNPEPLLEVLAAGDPEGLAGLLHNDLEEVAFELRPELPRAKAALLEAGALGASLSGSGPTLFALAESEAHAHEVAAGVEGVFESVAAVSSRPACVESATGLGVPR
ncbi:4-(cytidine 5'-diphospho)-2-C-methyl-D-erythritol kinase [soil metagenome]